MNTRRTFLRTASLAAVTTGLIDWEILARAAASGPLIISDAKIIHHVLAASNCVASQSETLCPMLEFLFQSRAGFQHCQTRPLMAEGGYFAMAEEPGLGPALDFARLELEPASG